VFSSSMCFSPSVTEIFCFGWCSMCICCLRHEMSEGIENAESI
jgi:hypothetical protein